MWLRDYSFDGLRLDAVHAIIDTSPLHILEAIAIRVDELAAELGRELWVIAESDSNDPRLVRERERGGYGLHAQWNDDFHHALHALLTGEQHGYYEDFGTPEEMRTALLETFVYAGQYSRHRKRTVGRYAGDLPHRRFIVYSQNHDQVGNRAAGERLCHLVSDGRARMAAALTLLSPMVPMLFQGEEWAASTPFQYFTDLGDAHLRKAVTNGRRREFRAFGWPADRVPDPQAPATFQRSMLRWDEVRRRGARTHAGPGTGELIRIRRVSRFRTRTPAQRQRMRGTTACATCCSYSQRRTAGVDATSATRTVPRARGIGRQAVALVRRCRQHGGNAFAQCRLGCHLERRRRGRLSAAVNPRRQSPASTTGASGRRTPRRPASNLR